MTLLHLLLPQRADYLAHFVAGAMFPCLVVAALPQRGGGLVAAIAPVVTVVGAVIGELAVSPGQVDPLDVGMTALGALVSGAALLTARPVSWAQRASLAGGAIGFAAAAVWYRYWAGALPG